MLGLAAMTARQGAMLRSLRHGGEVWTYISVGVGSREVSDQNQIRVEQVLSKFSGALQKNRGSILRPQTALSYPSQKKNSVE